MENVREIAFEAMLIVDKNNQSNSLVKDILDKYSYLDKQDRSFLARIIEGTIERMITIDYVLDLYSKVPVKKMKPPVRALLRIGVYQILYMDAVPDSAAVNETVKLAKKRGLSNLSGFINGVLRNVSRHSDSIEWPNAKKDTFRYMSVYYSCPEWIVRLLCEEQGAENAECVLANSVSVRGLNARVNYNQSDKTIEEFVRDICAQSDGKIVQSELLPYAVGLHNIDVVSEIDAFKNGKITIQDISSMLVGHVSGIREDDLVLDMCAAPGGKTMHAATIANKGKVISCDISEDKADKIRENINRCGFGNIEVIVQDATEYTERFESIADVVVADVPCSGLGVMGRKNDIKYRLDIGQLESLTELQRKILDNAVRYLKHGGTLMFSTCTVHKKENEDNYEYLIKKHGLVPVDILEDLPEKFRSETAVQGYIQLYGRDGNSDGFFIAKFRKE